MATIAAVMVGTDGERFRTLDANEERLELARQIAEHTRAADLALLPAGFLAADGPGDVESKARTLARLFKGQPLLAGIDEAVDEESARKRAGKGGKDEEPPGLKSPKRNPKDAPPPKDDEDDEDSEDGDADEAAGGRPFWAFAAARGKLVGGPWQQRSAKSSEQYLSDTTARVVELADKRVGLLICGELYNHSLADSLQQAKPNLVANLCHLSMKRFTKSLARVADTVGRRVLHVQHVALNSSPVSKWQATRRDGAFAERDADWASYNSSWNGELWAEVKLWRV